MSSKEILEKAIQKAIEGGWDYGGSQKFTVASAALVEMHYENSSDDLQLETIIFNHQFAKALWGEKWLKSTGEGLGDYEKNDGWKHHLQQMVIADDPIEYLGENI